jgi:tetratricopeptide (TPR) repeat protein
MEQPPALAPAAPRAVIVAAQVAFVAALVGVTLWLLLRPNDEPLIRRADSWMAEGRYHYAADAYREALDHNPANRNARLGLVRAEYALHQYADAISLSEPLLRETDPTWHAATLVLIGMAADALGRDGVIYLQAAASLNTPATIYRISTRRLAEVAWARQNYTLALTAYLSISTTVGGPDPYPAYASQPAWDFAPFDAASDRQRALYYDTLLHASANLSETIATLQSLTLPELQGKAASFTATLAKGQPLAAGDDAARLTVVGAAYIAVGECGLARATLDRAALQMTRAHPLADLFAYRSVCRRLAGDMSGAQRDLQQALTIDPNSGLAHHLYAQYYLSLPQPNLPQAQHELDAARDADPSNPLLYLDYYNLALAFSDYAAAEQALTTFAGLAQVQPALDGLSAKARLANFYLDTGYNLCNGNGYQAAEAAGLDGDASGLDAQGWVEHLCQRNAVGAGLAPLTRATALDPASARIHYHLGAVYATLGETALARDELMWAQDLDPDGDIGRRAFDLMVRLPQGVGRLRIKDEGQKAANPSFILNRCGGNSSEGWGRSPVLTYCKVFLYNDARSQSGGASVLVDEDDGWT